MKKIVPKKIISSPAEVSELTLAMKIKKQEESVDSAQKALNVEKDKLSELRLQEFYTETKYRDGDEVIFKDPHSKKQPQKGVLIVSECLYPYWQFRFCPYRADGELSSKYFNVYDLKYIVGYAE